MNRTSVTSSESFEARAQRSEARRVVIWLTLIAVMLALTLTRRFVGGLVMSDNRIFVPYLGVLVVAAAVQVVLLAVLRRANRAGQLVHRWLWRGSAVFDLCVASALLA